MGHAAGKGGSLTYSNLTAGVFSWGLDYTADALETTDMGDGGERTYIPGLTGWTATASVRWDPANTAAPGDAISELTLTAATGDTYVGDAMITGLSAGVPVDGIVSADYTFQGTGTLTITL